jgi:hypothetical protein
MNRQFIRRNITSISIIAFIILFATIQITSPSFLYDKNGAIRQFGIGKRHKTIFPVWFLTIILAIFSYLFVLYYLAIPKFKY